MPEIGGDLSLPEGIGMENYVAGIERSLLQDALNQSGGVQTKAADAAWDLVPLFPSSDEEVFPVKADVARLKYLQLKS